MKLEIVTGIPFISYCKFCGRTMNSGNEPVYADLHGKPFEDYYCLICKDQKEAGK